MSGEGAAAAAGGQGAGGEGEGQTHWASSFQSPELRALAIRRGWTGPEQAVESYRHYEQMRGAPKERLLVLPEKDDAPEWGEVWGRLGRPSKAEEYEIEGADPELLQALHKEGISKRAAKNLAALLTQRAEAHRTRETETSAQELELEQRALRQEWGGEFDNNIRAGQQLMQRIYKDVGFESPEDAGAFVEAFQKSAGKGGYGKVMKFFARLGRAMGEQGFVEGGADGGGARGGGGGFGMTPEAAGAAFDAFRLDPEKMAKVVSGDRAANAEFERLAELASKGRQMGGPPA